MIQFHKSNIEPEFISLAEEFPEIFLEPSDQVLSLVKQYPNTMPPENEVCNLRFGFEHDSGWVEILRDFCTKARELVNSEKSAGREACVKSFIVKEKFGELRWQGDERFESDDARKVFDKLVNDLQEKSLTICETTGKNGRLRGVRWLKTLSDEEATRLGYE